ncbi:MAG: hypothetical protein WC509_07855 [Candidatus Izemoplasmatales bacterium]
MKRRPRRILRRVLIALILILGVPILTLNLTWNFFGRETTDADYSDWMLETLDGTRRVIDVAMLGAHDAMTSDIGYSSKVDPLSADSIQTGLTGALIKGFSVKQSKTQVSTTAELLAHGVRYLDVRLTFDAATGVWWTSHSYYSRPFTQDLADIEAFLTEHPGEFLLIDIQHVYGVDYDDEEPVTDLRTLLQDSGVLARAVRDDSGKTLAEFTVDDATLSQSRGSVFLFSKFTVADPYLWDYVDSIRSAWPNTDVTDEAFSFLDDEAERIAAGTALTGNQVSDAEGIDSRLGIRVMQGVLTMRMSGDGILKAIGEWSLLSRARDFNAALIGQEEFAIWLMAMPVVMVDYADTNHEGFLDAIMALIESYNGGVEI